jgi:hypothetical protein
VVLGDGLLGDCMEEQWTVVGDLVVSLLRGVWKTGGVERGRRGFEDLVFRNTVFPAVLTRNLDVPCGRALVAYGIFLEASLGRFLERGGVMPGQGNSGPNFAKLTTPTEHRSLPTSIFWAQRYQLNICYTQIGNQRRLALKVTVGRGSSKTELKLTHV